MGQEWGFLRWNGELMGVSVRGECPKCGHQVQTEAPRDRVTWRGPCPVDGCGTRVIARRISPDGTGPDAPPAATGTAPGGTATSAAAAAPATAAAPGTGPAPGKRKRSSVPRVRHDGSTSPAVGAGGRRAAGGAAADVPPATGGHRSGATGGAAAGADEPAAGPDEPATGPGRGTGSTAPGPDARPSRPYGHIFGW